MKQELLKVSDLRWDKSIYPRKSVSLARVRRLGEALRSGDKLPPILVEARSLRIVDGVHRWKAHISVLGRRQKISCTIREFQSDEAVYMAAVSANAKHGLPLSLADMPAAVKKAEALGIQREAFAGVLRMTVAGVERIISRSIPNSKQPRRNGRALASLSGLVRLLDEGLGIKWGNSLIRRKLGLLRQKLNRKQLRTRLAI